MEPLTITLGFDVFLDHKMGTLKVFIFLMFLAFSSLVRINLKAGPSTPLICIADV